MLHKNFITMDTNYMGYVRFPGFSKVLIFLQHLFMIFNIWRILKCNYQIAYYLVIGVIFLLSISLIFLKLQILIFRHPSARTKKITYYSHISLGSQEKELKLYLHNYVTNLWFEGIMLNLLMVLEQEYYPKFWHLRWFNI